MKRFSINGRSIQISGSGNSVVVDGNRIIVNGKKVSDLNEIKEKEIHIVVEGEVSKLNVDCCEKIEVKGNVGSIEAGTGDIHVNEVKGNAKTASGNIECGGSIGGSASSMSGNIECGGSIGGSASTMSGNIRHR
jgi:hypothetical protein